MVCEGALLWKGSREPEGLGARACVEELAVLHMVWGRLPVEAQFEERLASERVSQEAVWRERERSQVRRVPGLFKVAFCFLSPPVCLHSFSLSTKPKVELIH